MASNPFQPAIRKRARDKVKQKAKQRLQDVVQERRSDDLGDSFPNDWIEFAIIAVALVGIVGGIIGLVTLSNQVV